MDHLMTENITKNLMQPNVTSQKKIIFKKRINNFFRIGSYSQTSGQHSFIVSQFSSFWSTRSISFSFSFFHSQTQNQITVKKRSLQQEGATYDPRTTSGPRSLIFLALTLPFWLKCGPRDTNKGAMWPADENSCPPLLYRVCHGFRLTKRDDYFLVSFDHFQSKHWSFGSRSWIG